MSETTQAKILISLGLITATITILVQVMSVGSLKGKFENVIETHAALIREHSIELRAHDKLIERINGRMGLSSVLKPTFQNWKGDEAEPPQQQ